MNSAILTTCSHHLYYGFHGNTHSHSISENQTRGKPGAAFTLGVLVGGRVGRGADPRGEVTLDTSPRQSSSVQTHRSFQVCGPKCTMSYAHEGLSGPGESGDPWKETSHHGYEVWLCLWWYSCQQVPADTRKGTVLKVRNVNLKKPLIIVSISKSFRGMVTSWCLWRWEGRKKKMHWCLSGPQWGCRAELLSLRSSL